MSLEVGQTLGPYEIVEKAGAGGMGEVYKARDTRLGREVALKLLPPHLISSAEARVRFEREARVISRLNHPGICTLYDIGRDGDRDFLVLEFIPGKTLAARLSHGPLPLNDLLAFGIQIADALAKAHELGIVHRDLKPGNLMLTSSGIKLLDFGLSRPATDIAGDPSLSSPETADIPLTTQGAFVGTLAYMAPEQIDGKDVDARTDIFALGCVLFEMATGDRLFRGSTSAAILSSIMQGPSDLSGELAQKVPAQLVQIIERCLQRDPQARYDTAVELRDALVGVRDWGQKDALPALTSIVGKIQALDEGPESWQAFELGRQIERMIPDDPQLERLWPEFTRGISIITEPPGASVSIKYYGQPDSAWIQIGTTPLEKIRFPRGFTRLKIEHAGYRTVNDVLWVFEMAVFGATDPATATWVYPLTKSGDVPDEMELVPAGNSSLFMPGLDHLESEPTASFLMDRDPVTNREFKRFVDAGGYRQREHWHHSFVEGDRELSWEEGMPKLIDVVGQPGPAGWEFGEYPDGEDDLPVTGISWYEAAAYAAWAGKDLPTIFHWNRVAFSVAGSQMIPLANFSGKGPVPVGATDSMNRFGVRDLAGNVREWAFNQCDRPGERFILGGGWNDPEYAFADAYAQSAFDRSVTNGFRCIRPIHPEPNRARLERVIELPFRDFRAEKPVPDSVFDFFLRQFAYDKGPLDAVIEEEVPTPAGKRQLISFNAAYSGERMLAYLLLPPHVTRDLQTVILFPGSLAIHAPAVRPDYFRRSDFIPRSGRALVLPIYKGTYQRSDKLKSDYPEETAFYRDHVIMWGKDLARTIDYLETRDEIDQNKIAYYGLSWGGAMGAIMPAVEKRIKVVILYVAGMNFQHALPEVDQINYVSRVTQPTLMLNGARDFYFPVESSQLPMFDLLGTPPEHKRRMIYALGHSVPRTEMVKETLAWLDKYFGPV